MAAISTYHCPCSTLLIATTFDLTTLPRRTSPSLDQSSILPLSHVTALTTLENMSEDAPVVVRREDGFEKRVLHRCVRCRTIIGYTLEDKSKGGDVFYVLPGWLQTTEAMAARKKVDEKDAVLGQGESKAVWT